MIEFLFSNYLLKDYLSALNFKSSYYKKNQFELFCFRAGNMDGENFNLNLNLNNLNLNANLNLNLCN